MFLTNKEYQAYGGWYSARDQFKKYASVIACDYFDTSSSAGDWSGYIIQKRGGYCYMVLFSQENNYPNGGYTVETGNVVARFKGIPTREDIENTLKTIIERWHS